jgi:signal transduction histidine kinase
MKRPNRNHFNAFSDHLSTRRKAILSAWRKASEADPGQTTAHSLTRGQFVDHLPEVLDAFELQLRSRPGGPDARVADQDKKQEEVKHGLHRWQQGYRLQELTREWGHLQLCLFEELDAFATTHPEFEHATVVEANRELITLVNEAISESASQFERMQQAEAAGRLGDLKGALADLNEIERRRATLIHQAVHDLQNNVVGASVAASRLVKTAAADTDRLEVKTVLDLALQGVTTMIKELMELARLEAGQEHREIAAFDAVALVKEVGDVHRPLACERGLFLNVSGPLTLVIEGDSGKIRRLLQNLVMNALKYTRQGGVRVSLGVEHEKWWLMVNDTGPGLPSATCQELVGGLQQATASARESDEKIAATVGEVSHVLAPPQTTPDDPYTLRPQPGEGIGLSIVKRLCELLDASLELASSPETGTTFRVVLPRHYGTAEAR